MFWLKSYLGLKQPCPTQMRYWAKLYVCLRKKGHNLKKVFTSRKRLHFQELQTDFFHNPAKAKRPKFRPQVGQIGFQNNMYKLKPYSFLHLFGSMEDK